MGTLTIKYKDPRNLKARPKNPRTHTSRQIKQIAASIQEFGLINPVLVGGFDASLPATPALRLLSPSARRMSQPFASTTSHPHPDRAYVIADNRLAEKAGWHRELLANLISKFKI